MPVQATCRCQTFAVGGSRHEASGACANRFALKHLSEFVGQTRTRRRDIVLSPHEQSLAVGHGVCALKIRVNKLQTDIEVTTRLTEGGTGPHHFDFEGHETHTAVVLGCRPKTLYNKLKGYARETAFSHS
jgi:hypothetical protein